MEYWYRVYTEHSNNPFYSLTIGNLPIGLGSHFHGEMELDKRRRACKYSEVRLALPEYHANTNIIIQFANDHRAFCSTLIKPTFKSRPARRPSGSWFPLGPA